MPPNQISLERRVYFATDQQDVDHDGLPDGWEYTHGLDLFDDGTASSSNGPLGNDDQDEMSHLLEFAMNRNPHQFDPIPLVSTIEPDPTLGKSFFTVTYVRRRSAPGIEIRIDLSHDLRQWITADGLNSSVLSTSVDPDGVTETVKLRVLPSVESPEAARCYCRLRVTVRPIAE